MKDAVLHHGEGPYDLSTMIIMKRHDRSCGGSNSLGVFSQSVCAFCSLWDFSTTRECRFIVSFAYGFSLVSQRQMFWYELTQLQLSSYSESSMGSSV